MTNEQMMAAANAYAEAMEKKDARIEELKAALKPVAKWVAPEGLDDGHILMMPFTVADLRAAVSAYLGEKKDN